MRCFYNLQEWQAFRKDLPKDQSIGFVPTMGNLHAGHASLYQRSKAENQISLASLFINPTQFNQAEDFRLYPRTLEQDLKLLEELGVDYCILPDEQAMYPDGYTYQVQETDLSLKMEGSHRPGHFTGMLTVVLKLLNLAQPHRAYFGEKDYQQYCLIKNMIKAFFLNIEIIPCATIRENSGLAFSSRNNRLSKEEKNLADTFAQIFHGKHSLPSIQEALEKAGIEVDYIEDHDQRRYAAVKIGSVRLIDNYQL